MSSDRVAAVELVNVRKFFDGGQVKALDGVDLVVQHGEYVAVTGPSGCGKSTMLHLIAALDMPTSGTLRVDGVDLGQIRSAATYRRERVGLVFQLHNLLPQLTAVQNVEIAMFGTARSRAERHREAMQLLSEVDLEGRENRPPTKLSGGERQRVAIARALANQPSLLLADEPTGNLDERSIALVTTLFDRLRAERSELTMIVVTHDNRLAGSADRLVRMRAGRVDLGADPKSSSSLERQ
ncbi:MAG TPA: ABC transporter ATP-binding protein [Acidothermaceae bacterium]|nr:ABC transporter ATP-binding protein [Acidothermaceae bacterium]